MAPLSMRFRAFFFGPNLGPPAPSAFKSIGFDGGLRSTEVCEGDVKDACEQSGRFSVPGDLDFDS